MMAAVREAAWMIRCAFFFVASSTPIKNSEKTASNWVRLFAWIFSAVCFDFSKDRRMIPAVLFGSLVKTSAKND